MTLTSGTGNVCADFSGCQARYSTIAAIAFEATAYTDFCHKFIRLKKKYFKSEAIEAYPLKGRSMLSRRGLEHYRKVEFVSELFSLCRLQKGVLFSTTRMTAGDKGAAADSLYISTNDALFVENRSSDQTCSMLLAYLLERMNSFMVEKHPGQRAELVFKAEAGEGMQKIGSAMMNLFFRTPYGGGFQGLLGTPHFTPAAYSPGSQVASLLAYLINQHFTGNVRMREWFKEAESMQYVSAYQRDEYELKGINLIE
jgi:hypothetical protein